MANLDTFDWQKYRRVVVERVVSLERLIILPIDLVFDRHWDVNL